ncbi:MAG TPA: thioeseterase, partial [Paracoccaceae bacterium]|nr:thioeseterase [Paracoccaceae bacterium]
HHGGRGGALPAAGACLRALRAPHRGIGRDGRFFYVQQSMWRNGECLCSAHYRAAIVGQAGIVPPAELAEALGWAESDPPLPEWVRTWAAAEAARPWPPET